MFVCQHATAICCRGCIEKWYGIKKGRELTEMTCRTQLSDKLRKRYPAQSKRIGVDYGIHFSGGEPLNGH